MSEDISFTASSGLSFKDVDEIEMVSQRISQVKELKKSVDDLNKSGELDDMKEAAEDILGQLTAGHSELIEKKDRIEKLGETVKQLEQLPKTNYKQLTTLDTALLELEHEKAVLRKRLSSLEKLNLCIDVLSYKIYEAQHDYDNDMEVLRAEKEELLANKDFSNEELNAMLAEIDKRIQDRQVMHMAATASLETRKIAVQRESHGKIQDLNQRIVNVEKKRSEVLLELEDQKLYATTSEREMIDAEINRLDARYQAQLAEMKKLQSSGWAEMGSEEKLCALLETKGIKVTKSGRFLTKSGKLLTIEEADNMGIFDDLDMPWEKIKKGLAGFITIEKEILPTDEAEVADEEAESMYSHMTSEDVHYLKDTLGKPLTAAMAEILMKQPRDPIHYLGHWLFKYRYNQEVEDATKQEISELTAERARIAKYRWQAQVQEEAQRAVLNLIVRVEEEILRRELERAQQSQEVESDEAAEEYGRGVSNVK